MILYETKLQRFLNIFRAYPFEKTFLRVLRENGGYCEKVGPDLYNFSNAHTQMSVGTDVERLLTEKEEKT